MQHWISMFDYQPVELARLVAFARRVKAGEADAVAKARAAIGGRILGMVFFNPSLRTRVSFEAGMIRFGGNAVSLSVGGDAWKLEHRDGAVMDGDAAEHIKEAAPVLARYCDVLGVRTFAGLKNAAEDAADALIRAFARYSTVPVVNLESAVEHPCQGLADWMTFDERFGAARGREFTVTWAPQAKPTPMAVPHSAILSAAAAGTNVTLAHPPGYELNASILDRAKSWCAASGASFTVTHDQRAACAAADVLYVKSWGSPAFYGKPDEQKASFREHAAWMVRREHLRKPTTILMHCLPVRRNVVIADDALDDPRCVVVDQAENRMWAQAAILVKLLKNEE
ncbi:MAG: N-acetylornithine carbamoyltransferase [Phycisphaerae bacterium]